MEDKAVEILLFEAIQTALSDVTGIKTVEIWNFQDDNENKERPRLYSFVGVEINTEWENEEGAYPDYDQNQQKGNTIVTIHYIYEQIAKETNQWLDQRAIVHNVYRALNGLTTDQSTPLIRTSTPHEDSHGRVSDIQIIFSATLTECAYRSDDRPILDVGEFSVETQNDLIIDNEIVRTGGLDSDVVDPLTGELIFSRVSGTGQTTVLDGQGGLININSDKNIKINIVVSRNNLSYSQTLDIVNDETLNLSEGSINPYISGSEDLGFDWSVALVDGLIKLTYTTTSGLGDSILYYIYNKIV